jgi:hypothetical protein
MKTFHLTAPRFAFIVATRGALGAGLGMLLARRFRGARSKSLGAGLLALGLLTSIPAGIMLARSSTGTAM